MTTPASKKTCFAAILLSLMAAAIATTIAKDGDETLAPDCWSKRPTLAGRKKSLEALKAVRCSETGNDIPIEKIVVRLKRPPMDRPHETNFRHFVTWQNSESHDPKLCQAAREALQTLMTRLPKRQPHVYEWIPYGELEFRTSTNRICFLLGDSFAIDNGEVCNSNTVCVSRRMASLVQQTLSANQQSTLSEERFEKLSGAGWRKAEREVYELEQKPVAPTASNRDKPNKASVGSKVPQTVEQARKLSSVAELEGEYWEQLDFDSKEPVECFVVRLKRPQAGNPLVEEYDRFETWFETEVKEPLLLQRVERGIRDAIKHAPDCGLSHSGAIPSGEIEIRTNSRKCVVYLGQGAFVLRVSSSNNIFRSWTLAKVLDTLMREGTGSGLPDKRFRNFAGENSNQ